MKRCRPSVLFLALFALIATTPLLSAPPFPLDKHLRDLRSSVQDRYNELKDPERLNLRTHRIFTPALCVGYTLWPVSTIWNDKGSGAINDLTIMRSNLPADWVRFGDTAAAKWSLGVKTMAIEWDDKHPAGDASGPYLAKPVKYEALWNSSHAPKAVGAAIWRPVAPKGYKVLGHVIQKGYDPPALDLVRCVREDLVLPGKFIGPIYTTKGSTAAPCSIWRLTVADSHKDVPYLSANTFFASADLAKQPTTEPWVLRALTPDEAAQAAQEAMIETARQGFVSRMQSAVAKARDDEARDGEARERAFETGFAATVAKPTAVRDANAGEKLEGGVTATHGLPALKIDGSRFPAELKQVAAMVSALTLDKIPGLDRVPLCKGVKVENASFAQGLIVGGTEAGQPWMSVTGTVTLNFSNFGPVTGKVIVLSRLYQQLGLRTGFMLTVPTETLIKKIGPQCAAALNLFKFSHTAITYATEEHEWCASELPPAVRTELAEFVPGDAAVFSFTKGESAWLATEVAGSSVLAAPFKLLQTPPAKVLFTLIVPAEKDKKMELYARLLSEFAPDVLAGVGAMKLRRPALRVGNDLAMLADLVLDIPPVFKNLTVPACIAFGAGKPGMPAVSLNAQIPGTWRDPFGVRGLAIGNLGIGGNLGTPPALDLSGRIDLGQVGTFDVAGAFSATGIAGVKCIKAGEFPLSRIIDLHNVLFRSAFPKASLPTLPDLPLDQLKIKDAEFCVSSVPIDGAEAGLTVGGTLMLGSASLGRARVVVRADNGVHLEGWVHEFGLGPLVLSGDGPDPKTTADDGPILDLEYWPPSQPPYSLKQHCFISARAKFGTVPIRVFVDLNKARFTVNIKGEFAKDLSLLLVAEGESHLLSNVTQGCDLSFEGRIKTDLAAIENLVLGKVGGDPAIEAAVAFLGDQIFKLKSISAVASTQDLANGTLPKVKLHASVFGRSVVINTGSLVKDEWVKDLAGKVLDVAKDVVADPVAFFDNTIKGVAALGTKVGQELGNVFNQSPEKAWNQATNQAAATASAVRNAAQKGINAAKKGAEQAYAEVNDASKQVSDALESGFRTIWKGLCRLGG